MRAKEDARAAGLLSATRPEKQKSARSVSRPTGRKTAPKRRWRLGWKARVILASAAMVLGLVAWAALERALEPTGNTAEEHFDALIVLGSPVDADGDPSPIEQARVTEAVHEYERGVAPRIIFTGGAVKNRFVEAHVMARTAEAQGIPASAVFADGLSRSTIENTCNAFRIMRHHGWESAEVISSGYHLPRAALMLNRLPMRWRVHAAPALEPGDADASAYQTAAEILKTVYYLAWTRQREACEIRE
jgi:uncharacterized SAM-binding protein YcdF (DUF218 family)